MRKKQQKPWFAPCGPVATKQPRYMPPPDSELWPRHCRGELWTWDMARFYLGRCQLCAYACPPTQARQIRDKVWGMSSFLLCTNHPDSPGQLRDVMPTETCRNFKAVRWQRPRSGPKRPRPVSGAGAPPGRVRRISLGNNLFATVDAADFKWLSQYKWYANKGHSLIYATRRTKEGQTVYMHREIMKAPKGLVVDHLDHNTLNNRRCNLHLCTAEENAVNAGPHGGASGYVGVSHHGKKWTAHIVCRGVYYYLGTYDDPVKAAKARDRKAYELHGDRAYLNFPEDFRRRRPAGKSKGRKGQGKR